MLEFEKKILLTKKEYESLMRLKDKQTPSFVQINHYYDNDAFAMNALGITCRIRERNGHFEATIKAHQGNDTGCSVEHSMTALHEKDDRLFRNMNVTYQGSLKTFRSVLWEEDGVEIVIDKNTYLGMTDYELELEYASSKEMQAARVLLWIGEYLYRKDAKEHKTAFFDRRLTSKSKSERFFEVKAKEISRQFGNGNNRDSTTMDKKGNVP